MLWVASDGEFVHRFKDVGVVKAALFSPGGHLLLAAGADGVVRLRVATWRGRFVNDLPAHSNAITSLAFSHRGGFFATSSLDDTARVWELQTQRRRAVLRGHTGAVGQVAFSPDGHLVATASHDGTARVWDSGTVPDLHVVAQAAAPVRAASYAPDGGEMVTAGDDGKARVLTRGGRLVHAPAAPEPGPPARSSAEIARASSRPTPIGPCVLEPGRPRPLRAVRHASAGQLAIGGDGKLLVTPRPGGGISVRSARTLGELRVVGRNRPLHDRCDQPGRAVGRRRGRPARLDLASARPSARHPPARPHRVADGHRVQPRRPVRRHREPGSGHPNLERRDRKVDQDAARARRRLRRIVQPGRALGRHRGPAGRRTVAVASPDRDGHLPARATRGP